MKIIKFAYSRHFGELQADEETYIFATAREYGRMRRALTNPRFGFYNNVAISALLTSQLQNLSDRKSSKVTAAAKEVKDLSGCAVIVCTTQTGYLQLTSFSKSVVEVWEGPSTHQTFHGATKPCHRATYALTTSPGAREDQA